ncbi:hypothetical protein C3747_21g155 [Trypanosoma cruzi]|uniref:Uncharacterized protein n=2 Tax=Trypanosoma cruzi TaxID=5693 RepID=Q4D368_TRYCC|nr:hypothetical protein, conserved [Trypanosoma cruzi]EAN86966.1 hypothetical protein, conserved [Trypanosoma cruzi]PWV16877.1 hypothetical protein C3747_21g155 [Trypanosoma cruzi]RNC45119.1 hypothetical protein TcCL_NonESM05157 [Trypanosoma cruzi]|eukprot:XP_808817.1 hypothetical protein [Trypanosoma cruzi strain CL Brener]
MPTTPPTRTSTDTTHDITRIQGKDNTGETMALMVIDDRRHPLVSSRTPPQSVGSSSREKAEGEENARCKGRAIQRKILPQPSKLPTPLPTPAKGPFPLPLPPRTAATKPGASSSKIAVTSTSKNKVQPASSRQTQELPPSIFDDAPVQASLEYLTRPHRSWDSAFRIWERRGRRQESEKNRRTWSNSGLSNSVAGSTRLSCASSNKAASSSSISICSAPPTVGRLRTQMSSGNSPGCGVLRRGRFGLLPSLQADPEGLAVGGSRLSPPAHFSTMSRFKPLPQGGAFSPATTNKFGISDSERRGVSTPLLGKVREFTFTMQ